MFNARVLSAMCYPCFILSLFFLLATPVQLQASELGDKSVAACHRTGDMPEKFKMDHYTGTTPDCVPNGKTLTTAELQVLLKNEQPILIDVLSVARSVDDGFGNMWLPEKEHYSLPNAVWLPNVGYGEIKPDIERYLRENLARLTEGDKEKALVFFCVANCWMSWNIVQRAWDYGYANVYWYKNGTDSWEAAGLPLVEVEPVDIPEEYYEDD